MPLGLPGQQDVSGSVEGDREAGFTQSLDVVRAVAPHMVGLPEKPEPLAGIGHRRIFERVFGGDGNEQNCPPIVAKHTVEFPHRPPIVFDVLEHVTAENDIERARWMLNVRHIHPLHNVWIMQISRVVIDARDRRKTRLEHRFGGHVQHFLSAAVEEIRFPLEKQPQEPVPLERTT